MRDNKREFAVEQEATPGTAETLVAADLLIRTRDGDDINIDVTEFDTEEVQGTSSRRPLIMGRKAFDASISYILRGPASLTTAPAISDLLQAAMLATSAVKKIPIGAITSGPFVIGETVTGGTSSATGVVLYTQATGVSNLVLRTITGTFQAETLTGGTSGATATSSAGASDDGTAFWPADSTFEGSDTKHHVTARFNRDGFHWLGRGCLANLGMGLRVGNPVIVQQRFFGALDTHGDLALVNPATYPEESNAAPKFLDASLMFGAYTPKAVVDMALTFETNPEPLEDANDTSEDGVLYSDYQRVAPTLALAIRHPTAADKDIFQDMQDGTTFVTKWTVGSTSGLTWDFYAEQCQYSGVAPGALRNLATLGMTLRLNGTNNDELVIHQH